MAADDYYVIVAKILTFLYRRLRGKTQIEVTGYIRTGSKDFPISDDYMDYVLTHMYEDNLIEGGVYFVCEDGAPRRVIQSIRLPTDTQITPKGIEYLYENSMVQKALRDILINA